MIFFPPMGKGEGGQLPKDFWEKKSTQNKNKLCGQSTHLGVVLQMPVD
jgi:hypothetical protein